MSIVESSNNEQEYVDIDLSPIRRRKIRIDGDQDRILELNTTDIGIVTRLSEFYPKLEELQKKYIDLNVVFEEDGTITDESFSEMGQALKDIDTQMRKYMDEIFDSNVSELCAPSGNMFDPINGSYRFEYIIDVLGKLYEEEIKKNIQKRKTNVHRHTDKYKRKKKEEN